MQTRLDDHQATGMMMWATPTAMRNTCRQWLDSTSRSRYLTRCNQMFAWMRDRMGDGNGWMMHGGNMMGVGPP
jgi:hypothetical protein